MASYRCDELLPNADHALYRAVDIAAPASVVFRWLCQLKVAPYSYDWIDNAGRKSPPALTPGVESLARGQQVMTIFTLVDYEPDEQITLLMHQRSAIRLFGLVAGTYRVFATTPHRCRLAVKLLVQYPSGLYGAFLRRFLPWGDLLMMRKQLLTLKRHAEADAALGAA
jgi:hypothetical protein